MEFGPRDLTTTGPLSPVVRRQTSAPPKREMQDTCLFLHVVKDGNQRRLVRRLEHANSEELGDFDDTASWESWRSGLDSCTGRSRAGSELSICSNPSARAMQDFLAYGIGSNGGMDAIEDLHRKSETERHMEHFSLGHQKRAMVKPFQPSILPGEGRPGRVLRTSSNFSQHSAAAMHDMLCTHSQNVSETGEVSWDVDLPEFARGDGRVEMRD